MDSSEMYDAFRSEVMDEVAPYLWKDAEVWRIMNDAYRMFVRLTGGVADFDSDICAVDIVANEPVSEINSNILRIMNATRRSDGLGIKVVNFTDLGAHARSDYGQSRPVKIDNTPGQVWAAVIGMRKNAIRWLHIPVVDDVADLHVYRLPLNTITGPGQSFDDVEENHHLHLLKWMKHLAYAKHDVETYNRNLSENYKQDFVAYCEFVKAEWERYKHKPRFVAYGGI